MLFSGDSHITAESGNTIVLDSAHTNEEELQEKVRARPREAAKRPVKHMRVQACVSATAPTTPATTRHVNNKSGKHVLPTILVTLKLIAVSPETNE